MERSIAYAYDVPRKRFGKQPQFSMTPETLLDSIEPNPADQKLYGLRNPVSRGVQVSLPQSEHEINTLIVEKMSHGINHAEGGWPKDVHYNIEEETLRYRRRIEREDTYVHAVMTLCPKFEKYVKQNNTIDIYEQYFRDMEEAEIVTVPTAKINNFYRDPDKRPIADVAWTHEEDSKMVVTYCSKKYPVLGPVNKILTCYIWELDNPHNPAAELLPPVACWCIACSPVNPAIIVGGLEDGRVCVFDRRAEKEPVNISQPHNAHRDPVSSILYIQSRLNTEFFTGSSDGQCMWYDIRDLTEPLDNLIMSVNVPRGESVSFSNSEGISTLQFDRTLPTRFLAGTETGLIINVNRKGKTHQDIMSGVYNAHAGPVKAVHRSPCSTKMLLSCGDWAVHIWSEDIKTSPIISGMVHRYQLMDAVWAPERYSSYMTVGADGKFRYWDLLRRNKRPVISMPVSKYPLLRVVPHEHGRLIAIGGMSGSVILVALSQDLVMSAPKDKQLMIQLYEREYRREQILTSRLKEIRLKMKTDESAGDAIQIEEVDEEAAVRAADEEYRRNVIDEIRRSGIPQTSEQMRKR